MNGASETPVVKLTRAASIHLAEEVASYRSARSVEPSCPARRGAWTGSTYCCSPPSNTTRRAAQREWLREIFGEGVDWREVLSWPEDRARRQEAVDRVKERFARAPETPKVGRPVHSEMTVADLGTPGSPGYPSEYPARVEAWARSVAEHRVLTS